MEAHGQGGTGNGGGSRILTYTGYSTGNMALNSSKFWLDCDLVREGVMGQRKGSPKESGASTYAKSKLLSLGCVALMLFCSCQQLTV